MDPKVLRGLTEAYSAVYDEDLRDELEEMMDEFAGIEELTDEEIDAIVEETIDEMLEEGFEFDEVEEIFEEVLSEAKVTMSGETRGSGAKVTSGAGSKMAASARLSATKGRKRAEKIAKVKGAVKSALGKAKAAVKSGASKAKSVARKAIDEPARKYAEKRGVVPSKSGKSALGSGTGIQSVAYKQRTPEGRREVRSRVASDIKGRIKQKIAQAQVGAYGAARKAGQSASDTAGRAKQSAKNTAAKTKRGIKGAIAGAASKVASGASKLASRMSEEVDVYDIVLEHLIENGYAETQEAAETIMVNMSGEWRTEILEGMSDRPLGLMHQFARGMKQKKGEKFEQKYKQDREGNLVGKYSDMQRSKRTK